MFFVGPTLCLLEAHEATELEKHAAEGRELLGCDACKNKWRRIEVLGRLKEFLLVYREAWRAFKSGVKDVVFPAGTYWMVRHAGCAAASPG